MENLNCFLYYFWFHATAVYLEIVQNLTVFETIILKLMKEVMAPATNIHIWCDIGYTFLSIVSDKPHRYL